MLLAQFDPSAVFGGGGEIGVAFMAIMAAVSCMSFAVMGVMLASMWRIFTKAGEPGWAALVPIYNAIKLFGVTGTPVHWILFMFIPLVNLYFIFKHLLHLARSFGKGDGWAIGMMLFGVVFLPMLAFGDATYRGPAGPEGQPAGAAGR